MTTKRYRLSTQRICDDFVGSNVCLLFLFCFYFIYIYVFISPLKRQLENIHNYTVKNK